MVVRCDHRENGELVSPLSRETCCGNTIATQSIPRRRTTGRLRLGLPVKVLRTELPGVLVAETTVFVDQRGAFSRWFCEEELGRVMERRRIVHGNYSRTTRPGALRGFHYQHVPHAEMKL